MTEQMVETAVKEQGAPVSAPAPATPTTQPDLEALKSAAKQEALREAQSAKDREIARLHQQYQQRERTLLTKVKGTLKASGFENADQLEQQLAAESELGEYRALKNQQAAQAASLAHGEGLIRDIAENYEIKIPANDPRLWGEPFDNWDQFRERVRSLARAEVAARRAAEKAAQETSTREAVDTRLTSGELTTLGGVPAGGRKSDAAVQDEYQKKLKQVQGNVDAIVQLKREYRKKGLADI